MRIALINGFHAPDHSARSQLLTDAVAAMAPDPRGMARSLQQLRKNALARPDVKRAYDELADEFASLDEVLKARAEAGLTQTEVGARIGTTQSAVVRLESAASKHSPSIATLQRYARVLGYRVEVRLVKEATLSRRPAERDPKRIVRRAA